MTGPSPEERRFLEQRRSAVEGSRVVRGLDSIEARRYSEADPVWRLRLSFLPERPHGLGTGSFRVLGPGGEGDSDLQVTRVVVAQDSPSGLDVFVRAVSPERAKRLGSDTAVYRLKVDAPGLDRFFTEAPFRFDGKVPEPAAAEAAELLPAARPDIDYLAKDYESFRRMMLERMAAHVPEWTERNPADVGVAVIEVLAYAADYLSYYQDAVATEAYLDTARKRTSVRRHLRLVGHVLHEGCNARCWVQLEVTGDREFELPSGTALLTRAGDLPTVLLEGSSQLTAALEQGSLVFETMHPLRVRPRLDRMFFHSWGVDDYVLPKNATSAAVVGHFAELEAGDVLIVEQRAAAGESSDSRLRHPVRLASKPRLSTDPLGPTPITELEFFDADALPFALRVSAASEGGVQLAMARGNIVLADHGQTVEEELPVVPAGEAYRPRLSLANVTRSQPFDAGAARQRAAAAITQRPERAVARVMLVEVVGDENERVGEPWRARLDLLESPTFANEFVAETDDDETVRLRFGDGRQGCRPSPGARFIAEYRIGNGPAGHIGPDSIAHIVGRTDLPVARVGNPLGSEGAQAREPLERARLVAPRAFRTIRHCVTPEDSIRLAEAVPGVLQAAAEMRWTGSWRTLFLYVRRSGGQPLTSGFERRLREHLEPRLLAGVDLELRPPVPLPLEIRLRGVVEPRVSPEAVKAALLERLGSSDSSSGERGYFHPDGFGFAQPVHLDAVLDQAMKIDGVVSIEAEAFRAWGTPGPNDRVGASVNPGRFEVARLENRPGEPQHGILTVVLEEGS